jgi:hypothetical protein
MDLLLTIFVVVLVAGVALWAISLLPVDARVMQILRAIVAIGLILWVIALVTGWPPGFGFRIRT